MPIGELLCFKNTNTIFTNVQNSEISYEKHTRAERMANWLGDFGFVFVSVRTYTILFGRELSDVCVCVEEMAS
jgi:hypothetical protein